MELKDRFQDVDVWYDGETGDFVSIEMNEETGNVVLVTPPYETGSVIIHEFEGDDWEVEKDNFIPVPDEAYDNPVQYFKNNLDHSASDEFDVGYLFAQEVIEITDSRE